MIKAMFFDLDGTLLNSRKEISGQTRMALEKCKSKGIKLFIATARPPLLDQMSSWDSGTLALFDGGSYYNGGCVQISGCKEYTPLSDDVVTGAITLVNADASANMALQLENEYHTFRIPIEEKAYQSWGINHEKCIAFGHVSGLKTIKILIFHENLIDSVTDIDDTLVSSIKSLCQNKAQFYLDRGKCIVITGLSGQYFKIQ